MKKFAYKIVKLIVKSRLDLVDVSLFFSYFALKLWYIMTELKTKIKEMIIKSLELEDVTPADIVDDAPLFGESANGLGLDSIDALELGIAIKDNFGVSFSVVNEETKKHFYSVDTLAAYISANQQK